VPRFCSELELSEEVQSKAGEIIETTAEQGLLSGNSPTGYAASLLCSEKKTQREVADVAQVTEVTIRNQYQEQIEAMGIHSWGVVLRSLTRLTVYTSDGPVERPQFLKYENRSTSRVH
jgi:hypothetical protein